MINVNWNELLGDFASLAGAYRELPSHIAKKHLLASMRRAITKSGGVKLLRQNTPPAGTRRGRRKKGEKARSTGALRKAVMTKAKWIGTNKAGAAVAGLGYKYGEQSRKAIWHEFGTPKIRAKRMAEATFNAIREPVAKTLASELAAALEKAQGEVKGHRTKGYGG